MTIVEYKAETARFQRFQMTRLATGIAALFVTMAIAGVVRYNDPVLADILAPVIVFVIGLPVMLFFLWTADRGYRKYPALVCGHCEGNLYQSKSVVIATGNCPHCGRRVLADATIGT